MSQLGLGVMIRMLGGGSEHSASEYVGRAIIAASLSETALRLRFLDGPTIEIFDNGQSCCECRYMRSDDDVASLVGRRFVSITARPGPDEPDGYEAHETCFVEVQTDG